MQFDDNAELDTSQVEDIRGSRDGENGGGGGFGLGGLLGGGIGGLGVVGVVLYLVLSHLGGVTGGALHGGGASSPGLSQLGAGQQADNTQLAQKCKTGKDANNDQDCQVVAIINSVQGFWSDQFARSGKTYRLAPTKFFRGGVRTGGCGSATSDTGPFYCPGDSDVYIDLNFFQELETKFGAKNSAFVHAYVLAHEYGHHVQNLLGTSKSVGSATGPNSGSVRLELQADCYAGVWANHATTTPTKSGKPLVSNISQQDISNALDAASRIGDDYIQKNLGGGNVDSSKFSHGTSAQRQKWFNTGIQSGDPTQCDTFHAPTLG